MMRRIEVSKRLRDAYDRRVRERDMRPTPDWETQERDAFIERLRDERRRSVLEIGAATGSDAARLVASGYDVVCIDLSPAMVDRCRARGLVAHVMDVTDLRFQPDTFDAAYAMNCLVHVPTESWPGVLDGIRRVLGPGGLFYLGVYGGRNFQGVWQDDGYEPKRFFAHHSDETLRRIVADVFEVESFTRIPRGWDGLHFQSLVLRKPALRPGDTRGTSRRAAQARQNSGAGRSDALGPRGIARSAARAGSSGPLRGSSRAETRKSRGSGLVVRAG